MVCVLRASAVAIGKAVVPRLERTTRRSIEASRCPWLRRAHAGGVGRVGGGAARHGMVQYGTVQLG